MKYYIIAGEASGDLHASNLIKELKRLDPSAEFRCWGGDLMAAAGGHIVKHIRDISFMGFVEVLLNLRTILKNMRFCKQDILDYSPDVVVLVDYPGFNLRIAGFARLSGYRVVYYISPQIWAWKQSRVKKIKSFVHQMLVILPFEEEFYKKHNFRVSFVGHPLLDAIANYRQSSSPAGFCGRNNLDSRPVIAMLPGSRRQEIAKMLPVMLKVADKHKEYQFVVAGAPSVPESFYRELCGNGFRIVFDQTYDLLLNARSAMVTSGTATLETALLGIPEVVCYKGSAVSYHIARKVIRVKYISLVNLIMDQPVVRELIQKEMNPELLSSELQKISEQGPEREKMLEQYKKLAEILGGTGASARAAGLIAEGIV